MDFPPFCGFRSFCGILRNSILRRALTFAVFRATPLGLGVARARGLHVRNSLHDGVVRHAGGQHMLQGGSNYTHAATTPERYRSGCAIDGTGSCPAA